MAAKKQVPLMTPLDQVSRLEKPVVEAVYATQRLPRYIGNPLIEALPPALTEESCAEYLLDLPDFPDGCTEWPQHERLAMIEQLSDFMCPLGRHIKFGLAIDSAIRNGYVARSPMTKEHNQLRQELYERGQKGAPNYGDDSSMRRLVSTAVTTALLGLSGQGKTSMSKRIAGRYPSAIYHPKYGIYQVPIIHFDAPFKGASVKTLCCSILRALDEALPGTNYLATYAGPSSRTSTEKLQTTCAMLMHMHFVGLLVIDEIQFLIKAGSSNGDIMSALVSASNELGVPILFVGTPKASRILTLELHAARRSVGHGSSEWWSLNRSESIENPDEWEDLLSTLWEYQYVKTYTPLTDEISTAIFELTQGIIDLTIKLFSAVQWTAILDRSETITLELIGDVWNNDFKAVHQWVAAIATNQIKKIDQLESDKARFLALSVSDVASRKPAKRRTRVAAEDRAGSDALRHGLTPPTALSIDSREDPDDLRVRLSSSDGRSGASPGFFESTLDSGVALSGGFK